MLFSASKNGLLFQYRPLVNSSRERQDDLLAILQMACRSQKRSNNPLISFWNPGTLPQENVFLAWDHFQGNDEFGK
jgi:hypothetical protein